MHWTPTNSRQKNKTGDINISYVDLKEQRINETLKVFKL